MKRVIVSDDHSFIRVGLAQILRDEYPFVEITEVSDGEALVKEVSKQEYDLVITDLEMPGRNGIEALEQIKLIRPDLPVLVLTIYPEDLYAVRALKAGASGFMNKEAAPDELIKAIHRILLGRKYITPDLAEKLIYSNETKKNKHELLSNREFEIFKLLALGKTTSYISEKISLAPTTVSTHRSRIMNKLELTSNAELARYALVHRLIKDLPE